MEIIQIDKTQGHLVYSLFDKYRTFYKQPPAMELATSFINARLANNESIIFVATVDDGGKPVGFTQLYPTYSSVRAVRNWILNDLYVDKDYRKQGIGESLIKAAMHFAKEKDAQFVELSTAIDNYIAQSLYEQLGFEKQHPETAFYTYRISLT